MQANKTTRAFRTISEASDELDLQPHVLRFWESKFPQIKPIKRGGGRRFYRPDDIEFLRGIKTLLHDEKHPIKDVQKLIRVKGANRIAELGRSVEKASRERDITETDLVPKRIRKSVPKKPARVKSAPILEVVPKAAPEPVVTPVAAPVVAPAAAAPTPVAAPAPASSPVTSRPLGMTPVMEGLTDEERKNLEAALIRLKALRAEWTNFMNASPETAA